MLALMKSRNSTLVQARITDYNIIHLKCNISAGMNKREGQDNDEGSKNSMDNDPIDDETEETYL